MCKDEMRVRRHCSAKHNASILSMNDQTSLFHANHTSMFFFGTHWLMIWFMCGVR